MKKELKGNGQAIEMISQFTPLHLDILKEIGNIGAGNAATALSKLLNKKIEMTIPDVQIVSFDDMFEMAGGAENIVAGVFLRIEGDAPGNMFFVLPLSQATSYIRHMIEDENFSFEIFSYGNHELALSALQELGNILAGSYLSALSDFTNLSLYPSVPAISVDMVGAIISTGLIEHSQISDYVIVIDTALNDSISAGAKTMRGHFFLLPDPDSFQTIFQTLGVSRNE